MTQEPPPTQVDDIVVVGQRRSDPSHPFPERPDPVEGPVNPGDDTIDPIGQIDPCDDPETALEWNADAAAAEALRRMAAAAAAQNDPTHNLSNREYGAMICEGSTGNIFISDVVWGDPIFNADGIWVGAGTRPTVNIDFNACGPGNRPLAMVHSHPGSGESGGVPSRSDVTWISAINTVRGDNRGRIYVISNGTMSEPFQIRVYDETNADQASEGGAAGPEVNPDGIPCPGTDIT